MREYLSIPSGKRGFTVFVKQDGQWYDERGVPVKGQRKIDELEAEYLKQYKST